jgi:hypothetical protein
MANASRRGVTVHGGPNQSRGNIKMDEVVYSKYAAVFAALAACIGLGGLSEENTGGRTRSAQRAATGMETAKTAPTATGTAKAKIDPKAYGIANPARNNAPAAAVPAATRARQANWHKTKATQVRHFARTIHRQNQTIIFLLFLYTLSHLISFSWADHQQEHIVMFNQVGQMASSMAYIHAAIPLNISTYQHHISLFQTSLDKLTQTPTSPQQTLQKSIKDMAFFATKRLNKLADKLRTIDNVLPNDDLSRDLNARQKRFIDILWAPYYRNKSWKLRNDSLEGDIFDKNCNLKPNMTAPLEMYTRPTPPFRKGRLFGLIYEMQNQATKNAEIVRRAFLLNCYLNKQQQMHANTTTPPPTAHDDPTTTDIPDYEDFHDLFHSTALSNPPDSVSTDTDTHSRQKRQILAAVGVLGGVLGTILGIFNQQEIHNILNHVSKLETNQNLIINVAHKNAKAIRHFGTELAHLETIIESLIKFNPALVYARMQAQLDDLADHLDTLLSTIQQLQHQKLAIDLLDMDQLNELYAHLKTAADKNNYKLLIQAPQDIFQLDVSYVRKNSDVIILVHVPCLTDTHLLTIYRYANLPLPISSLLQDPSTAINTLPLFTPVHTINDVLTQFSTPASAAPVQQALHLVPETDLIAIGQNEGSAHRYKLLSFADLASCIQRNHVYLCEGHQVLRTDLEGSCLGAIYLQSQRGVRENCEVERKPLRETVFQVSPTDHIIISPYPHTTQVTCKNGTHYPIRIQTTTKLHLNPGCTLRLFNHTLRSDESLRLKPEPLLWTWSFNPLSLPSETMASAKHIDDHLNRIRNSLQALQNETVKDSEIPDHISNTLTSSVSVFSVLFWTVFGLSLLGLIFLTCWYCGARRNRYSRPQLRPDELPRTISQIADLNLPDLRDRRP